MKNLLFLFLLSAIVFSCKNDSSSKPYILNSPDLPTLVYDYLTVESSNPLLSNERIKNELNHKGVTNEKATLGRVLFYDKRLSINNKISCGTCHQQQFAFSDQQTLSEGFQNVLTTRNSMSISNAVFSRGFFWDRRTTDLNELVLEPIQNHIEMGLEDLDYLSSKLGEIEYYDVLFKSAYGDSEVTTERIAESLKQFVQTMISTNSDFDKETLSPLAEEGFHLFEELACASCHVEPSIDFSWNNGSAAANIGLDEHYTDEGIASWSNSPNSIGVFRVPSLRNVALTAPYMHDGRFNTLEQVVEHYNSGIQDHPNLDWRLQEFDAESNIGQAKRMNLNAGEKLALIAFLNSLTDKDYLTDVRYSDPFQ